MPRRAPSLRGPFGALLLCAACAPGPTAAPDAAVADASGDGAMRDAGPSEGGIPSDAGGSDASPSDAGVAGGPVLLSLNLHCLDQSGTPYVDPAARLGAIAAAAVAEGADLIAVQEACDDGVLDALALLEQGLEEASGTAWSSAWAFAHLAWEGTAEEAREGVGLLARGALGETRSIEHHVQGALTRVALAAEIPAHPELRLVVVHLDHLDETVRTAQAREAAAAALAWSDPSLTVVVAGDLNARAGTAPHAAFVAAGFRDASRALPADRIDHVFVHRGAGLEVRDARLRFDGPGEAVSDHPGVLVGLFPAAPEATVVTRITARVDVGFGHFVAIRGDRAPLDWVTGWPLLDVAADEWRFVGTELDGAFEYKVLLDDATWQVGPNEMGAAGEDLSVVPVF